MMIETLESRRMMAATIGNNPSGHLPNPNANTIAGAFASITGIGTELSTGIKEVGGATFGSDTADLASGGHSGGAT